MVGEIDVVKVRKDINDKIKKGMIGTIVYLEEGKNYYMIEFCDENGIAIDMPTLTEDDFVVIIPYMGK